MESFAQQVVKFNRMYGMEVGNRPTVITAERLINLKKILQDELDEIDELVQLADDLETAQDNGLFDAEKTFDLMVGFGDLMGDLQVYCASEMVKRGIPVNKTLETIMASNFSKMGADGLPIYDSTGKLLKGPNYWKPEPKLREILTAARHDGTSQ